MQKCSVRQKRRNRPYFEIVSYFKSPQNGNFFYLIFKIFFLTFFLPSKCDILIVMSGLSVFFFKSVSTLPPNVRRLAEKALFFSFLDFCSTNFFPSILAHTQSWRIKLQNLYLQICVVFVSLYSLLFFFDSCTHF